MMKFQASHLSLVCHCAIEIEINKKNHLNLRL